MKKILIKHVGNMGDLVFFVLPVLETLKKKYPGSHITVITAWGFKETKWTWRLKKEGRWGKRNQGGFCISLLAPNPHIDQLVHWHDTALSLDAAICCEEGMCYPTWNKQYYEEQKKSGGYDLIAELDVGVSQTDNPLKVMYKAVGLPNETYSNYQLNFTDQDIEIAKAVTAPWPKPRIALLESIEGRTTRGWDPGKIPLLEKAIQQTYGVKPIKFGGRSVPEYQGRPLTLRENIATLKFCAVGIGVLSGPLHFAAAVGLPTITLYADQTLRRTAPAYFLNEYMSDPKKWHRTILGPTGATIEFLKNDTPSQNLTPAEKRSQGHTSWLTPGQQSTKSPISVITVDEIMTVLQDVLE